MRHDAEVHESQDLHWLRIYFYSMLYCCCKFRMSFNCRIYKDLPNGRVGCIVCVHAMLFYSGTEYELLLLTQSRLQCEWMNWECENKCAYA